MKNLYPSSIRSKLILLGVLAFVPVVLLTVFNSWHLRNVEVAEAKERMTKILDFAILHEEEIIRETHRILSVLAEVPIVRNGGIPSDEFLARFLRKNPEYANLGVARADGEIAASAIPLKTSVNISDRLYFKDALGTRSFSVGQYQVGRITGTPVINFGYPILDPRGNVTGVVFAARDLSHVTQVESLVDVQAPRNSTYVKLDGNGAVLTSYPESQKFVRGHPLERSLFEKISKEKKGTFQVVDLDGVERLYIFSPFRGPLNRNEGYALLGIPTGELFSEVNRLLAIELAALAAIGILFIAVVWLGGDSLIVRPVGALVDATKRLAGGDLAARSGLVSKEGEIGQLSKAFDEMAEKLERGHHDSRRMQETVRESEERFRNIFRENSSVMMLIDPDSGMIEDANPAAAAFYGYSEDVLRTMTTGQINTLPEAEIAAERARALYKKQDHFIFPHRLAGGEIRTVEVHSSPVTVGGRPLLFSVIHDITESKRAEETLQESERRYRGLFEHMQEGIAFCRIIIENGDPVDFIYLSVNEAFESLTGLKNVEGRSVSEVIPGIRASDPGLFEIYGRVAVTGKPEKFEMFVEALQHWYSVSVYSPERGFFVAVFSVISDRKKAEEEREKLEAQFRQAQKMEAVGRLAGGVAHDFNNLLTVVTGYSELLLQKIGKESPHRGAVEEIRRAGERAASLTQQLLAFSRKQIIEPKVLQLDSLVADMQKMMARLIGENIDLRTITGKSLGAVKVDPGQLQQILMNLVVNARDAMPDGGKIVIETANVDLDERYCALHPYSKPGRFVMLSVSDTGHGMSEEVMSHIFEPFYTTKEVGRGTGLGLAMIYGAVLQAGGSIELYSEVGIGTTFKIYLPRNEEAAVKPEANGGPADLPGGTETVLVVEDEDIVRTLCVQILERLGYKVLQARNGTGAIGKAHEYGDRIDLLLTDVVMPGMNGSELATQLVPHNPEMKVLFTSGYTDDTISRHGILDEGVSFIGKPYTPSALARKVRDVLDTPG